MSNDPEVSGEFPLLSNQQLQDEFLEFGKKLKIYLEEERTKRRRLRDQSAGVALLLAEQRKINDDQKKINEILFDKLSELTQENYDMKKEMVQIKKILDKLLKEKQNELTGKNG